MNIKSMTLPELTATFKELGQPAFRAKQVYSWLHKGVCGYGEMTNIPQTLRDKLQQEHPLFAPSFLLSPSGCWTAAPRPAANPLRLLWRRMEKQGSHPAMFMPIRRS